MKKCPILFLLIMIFFLSACTPEIILADQNVSQETFQQDDIISTPTPFKPIMDEMISSNQIKLWIPTYLSEIQFDWINHPQLIRDDKIGDADCSLKVSNEGMIIGNFVYALTGPFNTVQDGMTKEQLLNIILNESVDQKIFLSENTYLIFSDILGELSENLVIVSENEIFEHVNQVSNSYGIIRFDHLDPKWKVLRIENSSPIDKDFDQENYFLNFPVSVSCSDDQLSKFDIESSIEKFSTRYEEKITYVLMTGTTALTRATADRMENFGNQYPGEAIKFWFENSDIRHISSETPFYDNCPYPDAFQKNLVFCSHTKYAELFTFLPVDIIELTGNHLLDKGIGPFENTLMLFDQLGLTYYAGGYSKEEAAKPVLIEHNGNKIAFLGCNMAGPPNVWATDLRIGVNDCNLAEMADQVRELRNEGTLPIVTFQYFESNSMKPSSGQMNDFRAMINAGAVIVSGSQSHVPMTMEIFSKGFIHYGLGNLFFDQMDAINNRREFIDRHIFYDGRYLGTELLTAMLENYAQPRPMTENERKSLLQDAFRDYQIVVEDE
ncbi:MAG: CapA family protein [Anaerolineaceae bacterium]|nr:CapA family protein [Anaerolineaceae bacterium]